MVINILNVKCVIVFDILNNIVIIVKYFLGFFHYIINI